MGRPFAAMYRAHPTRQFRRARGRPDPVSVLEAQNATRIKELVPVRMARMLTSPFAFLRGSAAIMAGDLANSPRTDLEVMACGDMHLMNFGLFASAERNLIFAINDFDEVLPGPWEWDVKRLAASAAVAALFLGGDRTDAEQAARAVVEAYVRRTSRLCRDGFLGSLVRPDRRENDPRRGPAAPAKARPGHFRQGPRPRPYSGARSADRRGQR